MKKRVGPRGTRGSGDASRSASSERMRHRIQFEFSPEAYDRLNEVRRKAGAASYAELVREAISTYGWLLEKRSEGYEIELRKRGETTRVAELIG